MRSWTNKLNETHIKTKVESEILEGTRRKIGSGSSDSDGGHPRKKELVRIYIPLAKSRKAFT